MKMKRVSKREYAQCYALLTEIDPDYGNLSIESDNSLVLQSKIGNRIVLQATTLMGSRVYHVDSKLFAEVFHGVDREYEELQADMLSIAEQVRQEISLYADRTDDVYYNYRIY